MLSKVSITSNSSPAKLQCAKDLTTEAIDLKIASDAPSRNTLNKLYTALKKAVGDNGRVSRDVDGATQLMVREEGPTNVGAEAGEVEAETEGVDGEGETKRQAGRDEGATEVGETLLEELLDDEEES